MIIWGSTSKNTVKYTGQFYCPRCRSLVCYSHRAVERYFTLYFIPLFPTGTLAEYIECQGCGGTFETSICELSAEQIEGMLQPWPCSACKNLNPVAETRCLRCQAARPEQGVRGQVASSRKAADEAAPPMPRLDPPARKKKALNSEYWKQAKEPGRCNECGVMNGRLELCCRACGSELGVRP